MSDFVANVCFPLSDLRAFAAVPVPRLGRPDWVFPALVPPNRDFVSGCGAMRKRTGREVPGWPGSRYFCKARRMLSLCDPRTAQFANTYKRLFFDGLSVGCVSVGLVRHDDVPLPEFPQFLSLSVRVGSRRPRALATIGGELADRFRHATTSHSARADLAIRLVEGQIPVMLGEFWHEGGPDALLAETSEYLPVLDWPVLSVFYRDFEIIENVRVPLWVLIRKDAYHIEKQAEIRRSLCKHVRNQLIRRHCERAALAHTLRAARAGLLDPASAQLKKYLCEALEWWSQDLDARAASSRFAPDLPITNDHELRAVALAAVRTAEATANASDEDFVGDVRECMDQLGIRCAPSGGPDASLQSSEAWRSLHDLLMNLFSADEIRTMVTINFPAFAPHLPGGPASPADLATSIVKAVGSGALRRDDLFEVIRKERLSLTAEITKVQALWK